MTSQAYNQLSTAVFTVLLAFCGAAWVPLAPGLELSNVIALLVIAGGVLVTGRRFRFPVVLVLLVLALAWLYFSISIRGEGGEEHAVRSLLYVLMAISLSQFSGPNLRVSANLGAALFLSLLLVSSIFAGKNLLVGIWDYLTSLNRSAFVYHVIRPLFNSFSATSSDYLASVINILSSALAVLFVIGISHRAYVAAFACGLLVLILFSASAVLAVILTLLILGARWFMQSRQKLGPALALLLVIVAAPVLIEPALTYFSLNVSADNASRAARLDQYSAALDYINASPLFGEGIVRIDGHLIHNALLFSWVTAGVVPAILIGATYVLAIRLLLRSVPGAILGDVRWCGVFGLTSIFLIRISIGGGGGLPEATAMTALAIAVLLDRQLGEDVQIQNQLRLSSGFGSASARA